MYIVRHAKASWDFPELPDVDRPIVEKGINNTHKIAAELNSRNLIIDKIISSHAKRAIETANIIAKDINYPVEKIEINKGIYRVDVDDIFDVFTDVDNKVNSLLILGHNPTFTHFANLFLEETIETLPTSGVVSISFETDNWLELDKAQHKTNFILFPKMLK